MGNGFSSPFGGIIIKSLPRESQYLCGSQGQFAAETKKSGILRSISGFRRKAFLLNKKLSGNHPYLTTQQAPICIKVPLYLVHLRM